MTEKAVLQILAIHADDRGYTWPSVDRIASGSGTDPETVHRQIASLLVRHLLRPTKKKRGYTRQVKVYRLPKITYESGGKCHPFKNDETEAKAGDKPRTRGGKSAPNNGIMKKHHHQADGDGTTLGTSIPHAPSNASPSSFVVEGHQEHQSTPARDHAKWPEYVTYCASKKGKRGKDGRIHDGIPTEKGFWTRLGGQAPQWRNKVKQPDYIDGFLLDGKFLTAEEANGIAADKPNLLDEGRFRRARKDRDGNVFITTKE